MTDIYGIDPEKEFNARDVRDAMIKCFAEAHKEIVADSMDDIKGNEEEINKVAKMHAENLILKYFIDNKKNFEDPTKEDLLGVCENLREYALNFRDEEIVEDNYEKLVSLIEKLK